MLIAKFGLAAPFAAGLLCLAAVGIAPVARADFDPAGRTRTTTGGGKKREVRQTGSTRRDGGGAQQVEVLINRYMGIVMARPGEEFPLRRLAELYRQRDGNVDKLEAQLQQRMSGGGADAWASLVALGGVHRLENRPERALEVYRRALSEKPDSVMLQQALARLLVDTGDKAEARKLYDGVLGALTVQADREAVLRTLMGLALDLGDFDGAKGYHNRLVALGQGSVFVRGELGRALVQRGDYGRAEAEFRGLVKASAGDGRALAPALRDLGQVLQRLDKSDEAIEVFRKALAAAGPSSGLRREIYGLMAEAYRARGRLLELIGILEAEGNRGGFDEAALLASLLEETGQVQKALVAHRQALRANPGHTDTRLRMIRLLHGQGLLDEAIREYEALIRAQPGHPDYTFELCEILMQRGETEKALGLLTRLEQHLRDDDQRARLADFYERMQQPERAMRLLQRLAAGGTGTDSRFVIDLGDRYYQQGDKKKAQETWQRLRGMIRDPAEYHVAMGEVLLDHGMATEGLAHLQEAVRLAPKKVQYLRRVALAWEKARPLGNRGSSSRQATREAIRLWTQILDMCGQSGDRVCAREARMHLVTMWALERNLKEHEGPLAERFAKAKPDIEAGRLLAEVQMRLRKFPEVVATLTRLLQILPGDTELYLTLERAYVMQRDNDKAIEVLQRLVTVDPKGARQYYQRMAQYAAELYRDKEAISYAAKAVALAPEDALGHRNLAQMYRRSNDLQRAIDEYRAALVQNDRNYMVYFELADVLVATGDMEGADELYRRVVRSCPDDELVARGARLSMQIHLGKGTLEVLERDLLPVVLARPNKDVYRKILVDVYGAMTFPLMHKVRYGTSDEARGAKAQLKKIGMRAVKPLLDVLAGEADGKSAEQRVAIQVLGYVDNKGAAPALFAYATGPGPVDLRTRAMIACGALKEERLLGRYRELLLTQGGTGASGPVGLAAAWAVARMGTKTSEQLLEELQEVGSVQVRAMALLGLGFTGDVKYQVKLSAVVAQPEAGTMVRAAAAAALGQLRAQNQEKVVQAALAGAVDPWLKTVLITSLAKLGGVLVVPHAAAGVFDPDARVREASVAALEVATGVVAKGRALERQVGDGEGRSQWRDIWEVPDGELDVRQMIDELRGSAGDARARAEALVRWQSELSEAAMGAVGQAAQAAVVGDALLGCAEQACFSPLTDNLQGVDPAVARKATAAAQRITQRVAPLFLPQVHDPVGEVRLRALRVLGKSVSFTSGLERQRAIGAVVEALADEHDGVQRAAIGMASQWPEGQRALVKMLRQGESWTVRLQVAKALESMFSREKAVMSDRDALIDVLSNVARQDNYAIVRQAALGALVKGGGGVARETLRWASERDVEPSVRQKATKWLQETQW